MKKIGSVIKLNNEDIKLKIGTVDKKNPEVIYLEGGFYVKPIVEKDDYKNDMELIKNTFNDLIKDYVKNSNNFKNNFMFFTDVADDWLKFDKTSFFSFQVFLKPSDSLLKEQKNFNGVVTYLSKENNYDTEIIKKVFEDNGYQVSKTKR